jgi:trehalose-phosphatase
MRNQERQVPDEIQPPPVHNSALDPADVDAVIVDMDGVITDTARLHADAWKAAFDPVLSRHAGAHGRTFSRDDYSEHVEGKRREDGVRAFLSARGVTLPEGRPGDMTDADTIHGVARRKDEHFKTLLRRGGASAYADALRFVGRLHQDHIDVAAISASRNADAVLRAAGVRNRFRVLIDGRVSEARGLRGKPAPDIFVAAGDGLGVPGARAMVAEDSRAGVAAARAGGFARVVGVARDGAAQALMDAGADIVVASFDAMTISALRDRATLPDALDPPNAMDEFEAGRTPYVFLDYDGTLTPIVSRPEDAVLTSDMRDRLARAAERHALAVVSGRAVDDLRARIGLDGIVYAGSHGLEVCYPSGRHVEHAEAHAALAVLDRLNTRLEAALGDVDGVQLERKRLGLAVHYRRAQAATVLRVERTVADAHAEFDTLAVKAGKMVFEFVPDVAWDKGRALRSVLDESGATTPDAVPIYIGDDVTDEDAFNAVEACGIGIAVGDGPARTAARWKLDDVAAVGRLLERLAATPK